MTVRQRSWNTTSPLRVMENLSLVLAAAALFLLVAAVAVDAVGRYLFGFTLPGSRRMTEVFFMPAVVFLAWSVAQRHRKHVAVDIVHRRFGNKTAAILNRLIDLLGLVLFGVVLVTGFTVAREEWDLWTVEQPSLPVGPSRAIVVLGAAVMVVRLGTQIVKGRGASSGDGQASEPAQATDVVGE